MKYILVLTVGLPEQGSAIAILEGLPQKGNRTDVVLTSDDLREIDVAAAKIQIQGARLPEAVLAQTGR
jgi:hypothetical protein